MNKQEYQQARSRIFAKFRQQIFRLKHKDPNKNGFSVPLAMNMQEAISEIKKETLRQLRELDKKYGKPFDLDNDRLHARYERQLKALDGDHERYAQKFSGKHHSSYKSENVEWDGSKLVPAKKPKQKKQQSNDWLKLEEI